MTLLTIHKSKGKEFPFVVYFNLNRSGGGEVETSAPEERRVAYVGATRAQRGLLLTADEEHYSHFLAELTLNPAFADYAMPYLERHRDLARKKREQLLRKQVIFKPSNSSFFGRLLRAWHPANSSKPADQANQLAETEIRLEALEAEIRYRRILHKDQEKIR